MFLTDPTEAGYVKNRKTASQTTLHIMRVLEPEGKKRQQKRSEKFIINSEMGPCHIIRVNEDGDRLPRVLSH